MTLQVSSAVSYYYARNPIHWYSVPRKTSRDVRPFETIFGIFAVRDCCKVDELITGGAYEREWHFTVWHKQHFLIGISG